jgi:iron complex transport system substrate-binding protein/vitamin B12 transport system substrate-binding protein
LKVVMPKSLWLLALLLALAQPACAEVSTRDATSTLVVLARPAARIITLAPHATELVYAAGAGAHLVGTVDYSDYPPAAQRLPHVGSLAGISLEAVVRLRPDLVVAWKDGSSPQLIQRLRNQGIAVFVSRPEQLDDVAREIIALGHLSGTDAVAAQAAAGYRRQLAALALRYRARPAISVYYQISPAPLFTVSDASFIGASLRLCGGRNVFGSIALPAPQVSIEAVVAARPQVMLAASRSELAMWNQWNSIPAVSKGTLYAIDTNLASRPGPRLAEAAEAICATLDRARHELGLTPR